MITQSAKEIRQQKDREGGAMSTMIHGQACSLRCMNFRKNEK